MEEDLPAQFYRTPDSQLCQGDILCDIPHLHLKPPLQALRNTTTRQGQAFLPEPYEPKTPQERRQGSLVATSCQLGLGMLLTYDCEIDNDRKHRMVALIRPLDRQIPPDQQEIIRDNRNFNFLYLPAYLDKMDESYVDLRRVSCLDPALVDQAERVVSLTDVAKKALYTQLFRYLTRHDISGDLGSLIPPR